ncbi:hypothetical protein [Spirosoma agri]
MLLYWGNEFIQFYNDAYRPSLGGAGKHPTALGQRGHDCWPEIWPTIKPLIDQVRSGGGLPGMKTNSFPSTAMATLRRPTGRLVIVPF